MLKLKVRVVTRKFLTRVNDLHIFLAAIYKSKAPVLQSDPGAFGERVEMIIASQKAAFLFGIHFEYASNKHPVPGIARV